IFLIALLTWQRRWRELIAGARSLRALQYCFASGLAISLNWLLFIWSVNVGRVLETSLGYFMTPLVNVLFGALFLRERLTRLQFVSVLLAFFGVLNLTFGYGKFPWIAVVLCTSWAVYGLLRKVSGTRPIPGLFLETTLLTPFAVIYLLVLNHRGGAAFALSDPRIALLLMSTGIVTGLPLVWFGHAARHLRLTTVGFLQYLAPTGSFFVGVFLYHEPFTRGHAITFVLIWIGLAIFTVDAVQRWRAGRVPDRVPDPARIAVPTQV
ncbi:MAG: EamA family transporter RarD, partial [Verrucomicrobiota bacterium]|nr:EamA family transporter RarD [Verrucomicrobiota bacterium]